MIICWVEWKSRSIFLSHERLRRNPCFKTNQDSPKSVSLICPRKYNKLVVVSPGIRVADSSPTPKAAIIPFFTSDQGLIVWGKYSRENLPIPLQILLKAKVVSFPLSPSITKA